MAGATYRIPNTDETFFINKYEEITKIMSEEIKKLIIGNDQNLDFIKLTQHTLTENFLELNLSSCIIPTITKPTRITHQTATLIHNIYLRSKYVFDNKSGIILTPLEMCGVGGLVRLGRMFGGSPQFLFFFYRPEI